MIFHLNVRIFQLKTLYFSSNNDDYRHIFWQDGRKLGSISMIGMNNLGINRSIRTILSQNCALSDNFGAYFVNLLIFWTLCVQNTAAGASHQPWLGSYGRRA